MYVSMYVCSGNYPHYNVNCRVVFHQVCGVVLDIGSGENDFLANK